MTQSFVYVRFFKETYGGIAIVFALLLPCLVVCLGLAVDYTIWVTQKHELQRIADQAAFAAARELYMANSSGPQTESVAATSASEQMIGAGMLSAADADMMVASATDSFASSGSQSGGGGGGTGAGRSSGSAATPTTFGNGYNLQVKADIENGTVAVVITQAGAAYFSRGVMPPPNIAVTTVARVVGGGRVCVIGLDKVAAETVALNLSAAINADQCGVFSNSTDPSGLAVLVNSRLTAETICSTGGFQGATTNYSTAPLTDCPAVSDPLADRAPPSGGSCDQTDYTISSGSDVLSPGVYCGGIRVEKSASVQFQPGVYVIRGGQMRFGGHAQITGEYVGVYLKGPRSTFMFTPNTSISLTAPKDGPLAGILFFEDRDVPELREYEIRSNDARVLVGTIYLPNGIFMVSARNAVATDSAYTAIVARRIILNQEASLTINSDYHQTDVPVPSGLGDVGIGGSIALVK